MGGFNMRHCCKFDAFDIWYLKDSNDYTNRTLFIGICPICNKQVIELIQKNIKTNSLMTIKKVGASAGKYTKEVQKDLIISRNNINKMKFKPKPYGWRYGINKEKKAKNGEITLEQYAADFFGNYELVKKK